MLYVVRFGNDWEICLDEAEGSSGLLTALDFLDLLLFPSGIWFDRFHPDGRIYKLRLDA